MKNYLVLFLLVILANSTLASHLAGGHMEYECLGGGFYKVQLIFFRDCDGLEVGPNDGPHLWLESTECEVSCMDMGQMEHVSHDGIDYGCGNTCLTGSQPGFQKWIFEKTIFLPFECPDWKASISISARNTTDYAGSGTYFNYILINNESGICNNSPKFTDMSVWLGCVNSFSQFQNLHTEADGDQVTFALTSPLNLNFPSSCNSTPNTFIPGLSFNQPFPSTAAFAINSTTGKATFTPTQPGTSYFGIKMKEYRSGVLVSETIRDGEIIVIDCQPSEDIDFNYWAGTSSINLSIYPYQGECFTIPISASTDIISVSALGLPAGNFNVSYSGIGTVNASASICPIWESFEDYCDPISVIINLSATTQIEDCFADGTSGIQGYSLTIEPIGFCQEYRFFTNRNPTSGALMPVFAKASNTIWVGDSMPPILGSPPPSQWGDVISNGDVTLEAGVEIIIPSCSGGSGSTDCVVLSGNQTLIIKPSNCSPLCDMIPLDVSVENIFNCDEEAIVATVNSGTPPYSYVWTDNSGNILGYDNSLDVHAFVSNQEWANGFDYNLYVEDANGLIGNFSGTAHGTARFYQPLWYNMYPFPEEDFELNKWYCYPDEHIDTSAVYLYDGIFTVYFDHPMVIRDGINLTAPWYGATKIEFRVFDTWGQTLHEKIVDLEGTDDWSLDNQEFYWNGTLGNTGDPDDCVNSISDVLNYTLYAENCQTIPHCETGMIVHTNCFLDDWGDSIVVTKSSKPGSDEEIGLEADKTNYAEGDKGEPVASSGRINHDTETSGSFKGDTGITADLYPNPASKIVYVNANGTTVQLVELYDLSGKMVFNTQNLVIDISKLASGTYLVKILTSEGVVTKQLVVN